MINLTNAYKVNGSYQFRGLTAAQQGVLHTCSDGKIVGDLDDFNINDEELVARRPIVGINQGNFSRLYFLKIPITPEGLDDFPTLWEMKSSVRYSDCGFYLYSGIWMKSKKSITPAIKRVINEYLVSNNSSNLAQIPISDIKRFFYGDVLDKFVERESDGQTGKFSLDLIRTN
jgi:hypothetical protein